MIDLHRPPTRLGPRYPWWVTLPVLLGASLIVVALSYILQAGAVGGVGIIGAAACSVALLFIAYTQDRLVPGGSVTSLYLVRSGGLMEDTDDARRPADPEERVARRDLRRGRITRADYERVIAYHHYAHNEITRSQYDEILQEISTQFP